MTVTLKPNSSKEETTKPDVRAFVVDLAIYFMDFLETNFHKRRIPKRSIRYRDNNNLFLGLNLSKYEKFENQIWKMVKSKFHHKNEVSVTRNKYTTKLPQNILDLINKQIDVISETDINNLISLSSEKITQSSLSNKDDAEKAFSFALDETSKALTYGLVKPFIDRLEKPIASLSSTEIEPIYSIEENLTDVLLEPLNELIPELVNSLILDEKANVEAQLHNIIDLGGIYNVSEIAFLFSV